MKRLLPPLLVILLAGGCAREREAQLPAACHSDATAVAEALRAAPAPVRLDGVPIAECLAKDSSTADVQAVGATLVETAGILREQGMAVPLGYLVGAMERGAARSQGIHLELVRRVKQEAAGLRGSAGFDRGLRAGRSSG